MISFSRLLQIKSTMCKVRCSVSKLNKEFRITTARQGIARSLEMYYELEQHYSKIRLVSINPKNPGLKTHTTSTHYHSSSSNLSTFLHTQLTNDSNGLTDR